MKVLKDILGIIAVMLIFLLYCNYRIISLFTLVRRIDSFQDWVKTERKDDLKLILFVDILILAIYFFTLSKTLIGLFAILALNVLIFIIWKLLKK